MTNRAPSGKPLQIQRFEGNPKLLGLIHPPWLVNLLTLIIDAKISLTLQKIFLVQKKFLVN